MSRYAESGFLALTSINSTVKDLEVFCKAIFGLEDPAHQDYSFVPMPYREPVLREQLKFGYYISGTGSAFVQEILLIYILDGFAMASPANRRAVMETVEALKKQGHQCVEIELPDGTNHVSSRSL